MNTHELVWLRAQTRKDLYRLVRQQMVRLGLNWRATMEQALALWLKAVETKPSR